MLYNGERIGDGSPPEVDIAVDPLEGTRLTARGHALGARGDRARRARDDVRPGPVRLHGEARRRPRASPTSCRLDEPLPDVIGKVAERKGSRVGDVTRDHARPPAPRGAGRGDPRGGARGSASSRDGDVSAALFAVSEGTGVDLLWGIGGTPEGVLSAAAIKCLGGRAARQAVAARRRRAPGRARRRLRPRRGARRRPARRRATTSSSPPPASPTASCCRASATWRRQGDDRVAGDALALRHRSHGQARHDRAKLREVTGGRYG